MGAEENQRLSWDDYFMSIAFLNAVLNSHSESCVGSTLYTTLFPCGECARLIIQSGISCVVYASDKHRARPSTIASRSMLGQAGITLRHHVPAKCELHVALGGGNGFHRISLFLAHAASLLDLPCALRPGSSEVSCAVGRSLRTSCLVTFCIGLMLGRWWPAPLRTST